MMLQNLSVTAYNICMYTRYIISYFTNPAGKKRSEHDTYQSFEKCHLVTEPPPGTDNVKVVPQKTTIRRKKEMLQLLH